MDGYKINHPYLKMKASDIPDEVILGFYVTKFYSYYSNPYTPEDLQNLLPLYPRKVVKAKLDKLTRRGLLTRMRGNRYELTDFGFATINSPVLNETPEDEDSYGLDF